MGTKSIKNYSTKITPIQTIGEIEQLLAKYQVRQMNKFFDDNGHVQGIYFFIPWKERLVHYKLPINVEQVHQVLKNDGLSKEYTSIEQARRVAWRLLKDWIDAQLSLVKVQVVTMHEVFLPYAVDPATDETLYDKFEAGNMPNQYPI